MKDLVGWQSKGKEHARSRKLPVSCQLAASMGGACAARRESHSEWARIISLRLQDTAEEMKVAVVKIHSVHAVKRLFL